MIKQVIVMRKDLNMRKGKMIAQGAHASMKVLLDLMTQVRHPRESDISFQTGWVDEHSPLLKWITGNFKKVCVSVDSEQELIDVYNEAKGKGMLCSLIEDNGITEFHGALTKTCVAIGPDYSYKIDVITGKLKLL